MPTLSDVVDLLEGWYPPGTADEQDAVGLVHGDPAHAVGKVLFAVDPTIEVAREAASWGADLLVVHHPLFLAAVHGFAETTPKGRTLATLVRAGCALFTAHTNADRAEPGVSDAMAAALGLTNVRPLRAEGTPLDKLDGVRPGGRRRAGPRRALRGRRRADRGLRVRVVHVAGRGPVPPARGRRTRRSDASATSRSSARRGSRWCSTAVAAAR